MSLSDFRQLMGEVSGRSAAVSLYYLGDPLVHPELEALCQVARDAGLNSHISTNFSFGLSDERIRNLLDCGLTHITVCVDGMAQDRYEKTRVGGKIAVVLDNLERLLRFRRELGRAHPRVEVQFIKFQHNLIDLEPAREWCEQHGVDQFSDFWGALHNMTEIGPFPETSQSPKPGRTMPSCWWPYFSLVVKYNGEVIPCCNHRQGEQYREGGEHRALGNVVRDGMRAVWNSSDYRALRRLVIDPERSLREAPLQRTFCSGCRLIYQTDKRLPMRYGRSFRWEDLYERDSRGNVVRKNAKLVQLGSTAAPAARQDAE